MTSLICKLFGHRWKFRQLAVYINTGGIEKISCYVECERCQTTQPPKESEIEVLVLQRTHEADPFGDEVKRAMGWE